VTVPRFNERTTHVTNWSEAMSTLIDRYRARRDAARRRQAIERALHAMPSRALRDELMEIASH
jgi:hypothetical protein